MIDSCSLHLIGSDRCLGGSSRVWLWLRSLLHRLKITRWQRPYQGYFGSPSVQWEEAETRRPSLYTVYGSNTSEGFLYIAHKSCGSRSSSFIEPLGGCEQWSAVRADGRSLKASAENATKSTIMKVQGLPRFKDIPRSHQWPNLSLW